MIGIVADVHLANHRRHGGHFEGGVNQRCRAILVALGEALTTAEDMGCEAVFVLGDLFETVRPEPQIISAAQEEFLRLADTAVIILLGNHDRKSGEPGDHALGPMDISSMANVVAKPDCYVTGDAKILLVPYMEGPATEWLPRAVKDAVNCTGDAPSKPRVLMAHVGIIDDETPPWLRGAPDAVHVDLVKELCKQHDIGAVFAGHWHQHKVLSKNPLIVQVGALVPRGWGDEGLDGYGTLCTLDPKASWASAFKVHEVPGPRFVSIDAGDPLPDAPGCKLFVRVRAAAGDVAAEAVRIKEAVATTNGRIVAGEIEIDDAEARAASRTAAAAARSAETLEKALHDFVWEMPLEEGVDRASVLSLAKGYLGSC